MRSVLLVVVPIVVVMCYYLNSRVRELEERLDKTEEFLQVFRKSCKTQETA